MTRTAEAYTRSYPAVPTSVPRARAELTDFARDAGASDEQLDAIRLAASEAITNAVLHAYQDSDHREPVIQVCASMVEGGIWILVADEGGGLRRRTGHSPGLGLGLVLIAQLAQDFQLVNRGGGGTELRMRFGLARGESRPKAQRRGSLASAASPALASFSTTR